MDHLELEEIQFAFFDEFIGFEGNFD